MTCPELEEVLAGAFEYQDKCFYYAKVMKYPKKGGFKSILSLMKEKTEKEAQLEEKMDRWMYLTDLVEQIESQK